MKLESIIRKQASLITDFSELYECYVQTLNYKTAHDQTRDASSASSEQRVLLAIKMKGSKRYLLHSPRRTYFRYERLKDNKRIY